MPSSPLQEKNHRFLIFFRGAETRPRTAHGRSGSTWLHAPDTVTSGRLIPREATDMNRRILLQLTAPTVLIGTVLFGACLASVWSINRLQANLATILQENVTSLEAAGELEIQLRQLRFHSFLDVIESTEQRRNDVEKDHEGFENAME